MFLPARAMVVMSALACHDQWRQQHVVDVDVVDVVDVDVVDVEVSTLTSTSISALF